MPRILSTAVHTNLSRDRTEAAVSIVSEFESEAVLRALVLAEITQAGLPVTSVEDPIRLFPGETSLVQSCEILRARLWWPRRLGDQALYRLRLTLASEAGEAIARREFDFGIRQLEAAPKREEGSTALPESLVVNGEPFPLDGRPWVCGSPLESLDDTPPTVVRLLEVTGGVERDEFYDRCDHLGLLVWQELPADDPEALVARVRSHPSLAFWSGAPDLGPVCLAQLQAVVESEDPQRMWVVSGLPAALRVTAEAPRHWRSEAEFRAEVRLHNCGAQLPLLNIVAAIADAQGQQCHQENLAAEAPAHGSETVDTLSWRFPPGFAGEFTLSLEVIDEEGETLTRSESVYLRSE